MPTTKRDYLADLRAQRDAIKAGTNDKKKLRVINRTIRMLRGTTEEQDLKDAWGEVKDMSDDPATYWPANDEALAGESTRDFQESVVHLCIAQKAEGLPEDDPDPKVLDRKKIRNRMKKAAEDAAMPEGVRKWLFERLAQHFDLFLDTAPIEAVFTAERAKLTGGEMSLADIVKSVEVVENNRSRLKGVDA